MDLSCIEVLLVEDNPSDAELTIRELRKNNFANHLIHVKNGADALDLVFSRGEYAGARDTTCRMKLMLLDIHMPKMSGLEVLREIKADPRTKAIPVVILTSSKEDPDIKHCYDLGANGYIVKPVEFDRFATVIRDLGMYWLLLNEPPIT